MTTLMIYVSAFFLGGMITLIVTLAYAIMTSKDKGHHGDHD